MKKLLIHIAVAAAATLSLCAGEIILSAENDFVFEIDYSYTHGTKLMWMNDPNSMPSWLRDDDDKTDQRWGFSAGQNIYTPRDKKTVTPLPDQRPYAGWLYLGVVYEVKTQSHSDYFELDIGVVGPSAMGEEVQNGVHKLINNGTSKGWDNQLSDEPAAVAVYRRKWNLVNFGGDEGWGFQTAPHAGGALGTVMTYADAGFTVRAGYNLQDDFGPTVITPSVSAPRWINSTKWGAYLFVTADGRFVAQNIFLDGNTFRDSLSVDKKHFVGDIEYGGSVRMDPVCLTFSMVTRSAEYDGDVIHSYASASIRVDF